MDDNTRGVTDPATTDMQSTSNRDEHDKDQPGPRQYRTKALWTNAVQRLSNERNKRKDFAAIAFAMMNSNKEAAKENHDAVKQDGTDASMTNHLQGPPSNSSSLRNGKIDERMDFFNSYSHQDFFSREDDSTDATHEAVAEDFASVFKRGLMYKGIYWPSLTNSFQSKHLELAYLRYSHRQRQKALIIVNIVDLLLKAALIVVWAVQSETLGDDGNYPTNVVWSVCCMSINIAVSILGWWRCFANNYLHWAAVCTWLLLTTQSSTPPSNCLTLRLSFTDSRFRGGWLRLQSQTRPGLVRPVHGLRPLRDAAVALEVVHDRRVSLGSRSHHSHLR
jgi:hypothetical protein